MDHKGRQRFAAQLCQYVGVRLYAQTHGFSYALPDWIGSLAFTGMRPWSVSEHIVAQFLPTIHLDDLSAHSRRSKVLSFLRLRRDSSMEALYQRPRDNINFYGYLIDEYSLGLYHHHRDLIRTWFTWKPEIESAFRTATRGLSWVGLHVRRGDFAKPGRIVPVQAHLDALLPIRGDLPIYLASDDPAAHNELDPAMLLTVQNPLPDLYAYTPGDLFDFWMLQQAHIIVSGGSSFSWWAAFLGRDNELYAPPLTHLWGKSHVPPPPIVRQKL